MTERIVDVTTMERAFQRQERHGGSLGTNLLELGAIDARLLTRYLTQAFELSAAPDRWLMDIDRAVVRMMTADDVARLGAIPIAIVGEVLAMAVAEVPDQKRLELLREKTGRELNAYIVPEFRFEQLAAALYGLPLQTRFESLTVDYPLSVNTSGLSGSWVQIAPGDADTQPIGTGPPGVGWSSDQLGRFLTHCRSRDDILNALMGFVGDHAPRRFVLAVSHGRVRGFGSQGAGVDRPTLRTVEFSAERALAAFGAGRGVTSRLGDAETLGVEELYRALALDPPHNVLALAIHIGPHPALFVVTDNGPDPFDVSQQPIIELAVTQAAAALMGLVRQKKLQQSAVHTAVSQHADHVDARNSSVASLDAGWVLSSGVRGAMRIDTPQAARSVETASAVGAPLEASPKSMLEPSTSRPAHADLAPSLELRDTADFGTTPQHQLDRNPDQELVEILKSGPPASSQQRNTPATWPSVPSAEGFTAPTALVDALLSEDDQERLRARAELLLAGSDVLNALFHRFPGPVNQHLSPTAPLHRHGPLLGAIGELGQRAMPFLIDLLQSGDRQRRYYAVLCFHEIRHNEVVPLIGERLLDREVAVQDAARHALEVYQEDPRFPQVLLLLRQALLSEPPHQQVAAANALAHYEDVRAVPLLIEVVSSEADEVYDAALAALERLTFQSFGRDSKRWRKWHKKHGDRPRHRWLIDSVTHRSARIRELVVEALRATAAADIEYDPDAGRRARKRAQAELAERLGLGRRR